LGGIVSAARGYLRPVPPRNPYPTAGAFMPDSLTMRAVREAVQHCEGCPLFADATQAVFGEGTLTSEVMLVGEQPGDQEDRAGAPFVGPAGKLLDRALEEAGIDRSKAYVTNAVKHFKWKTRGTRRIHDKPTWTEQMACRPWLEAELALVKPKALVLMGATAAQSLLGKQFKVTQSRGVPLESELAELVTATIHPSAVLRGENREELFAGLVDDLRIVAERL
jgi:uracil-DNA glycosylase family protein